MDKARAVAEARREAQAERDALREENVSLSSAVEKAQTLSAVVASVEQALEAERKRELEGVKLADELAIVQMQGSRRCERISPRRPKLERWPRPSRLMLVSSLGGLRRRSNA